jgi:hypothetical protein
MEQLTQLEFLQRLPKTTNPIEILRRERLFDQREYEYEQLVPGQILYAIKNKLTGELAYKTAASSEAAVKALGWNAFDCRHLPIAVGKEKQVMSEDIKAHLKEIQQERHVLRNSGKKYMPVEELNFQPVTSDTVQAQAKIPLKNMLIALWQTRGGMTQEQKISAIAQLLKIKNPLVDVVKQSKWYYYKLKREVGE